MRMEWNRIDLLKGQRLLTEMISQREERSQTSLTVEWISDGYHPSAAARERRMNSEQQQGG
jgi:hypothetical protein